MEHISLISQKSELPIAEVQMTSLHYREFILGFCTMLFFRIYVIARAFSTLIFSKKSAQLLVWFLPVGISLKGPNINTQRFSCFA